MHASGDWRLGANFFSKEFILNYVMATYSKPQVIHFGFNFYFPSLSVNIHFKCVAHFTQLWQSSYGIIWFYCLQVIVIEGFNS